MLVSIQAIIRQRAMHWLKGLKEFARGFAGPKDSNSVVSEAMESKMEREAAKGQLQLLNEKVIMLLLR
jgi:hypothetical protein